MQKYGVLEQIPSCVLPSMSRGNSNIEEEEDGVKGKLLLSCH